MAVLVDRLTPSDVRGARVHWLLDLTFAGVVHRLADDELDVETEDGTVLHYEAALDPELAVTESLTLLGDSSGQLSVPIEAVLSADVPALVAQGHNLGAATGTLCRWVDGTVREAARTVLVGRVSDPEYGAAEEPVNFSLEEVVADDTALTGSPLARVDGWTWEHADTLLPEHLGLPYPIVYGTPGRVSTAVSSTGWVTGSAALWVDFRESAFGAGQQAELRALVAGHHVTASEVRVNLDEDPRGVRMVVRNGYDARGQPVAFIPWFIESTPAGAPDDDYDAGYAYTTASGDLFCLGATESALGDGDVALGSHYTDSAKQPTLYVGWYDVAEGGGGLKHGGELVRDAGPVLAHILGYTSVTLDQGQITATHPALSRFKIDCVIEERTKPWDWVRDNLLPILPVTITSGPSGLYWVVWPFSATSADATIVIDADVDPETERVSPIRYDTSDVANRFTLRYAYSYRTQTYVGSVTAGADGDAPADEDEDTTYRVHPLCTYSRARLGRTVDREISSVVVYDDNCAWAILDFLARAYALPRREVQYRVPEVDYVHVQRGAVVSLTDSEVAFDSQVCVLREIVTDGSGYLTLTLTIFEDPLRDLRAAG